MAAEGTQEQGAGRATPMPADTSQATGGAVAGHKELMRLEDRDPGLSPQAAVPRPPGETDTPPPGKGAKPAGKSEVKSPPQETRPSQPSRPASQSPPKQAADGQPGAAKSAPPPPRPVSEAKAKMKDRLPSLADDAEVGREKEQTVARDGKADLGFTGTLLGSAASSAPKGQWQELRIYSTSSGKHVFSRVTRTIYADENDKHEAEVFDPSPTSVPSQLIRSARELAKARPMTWRDAAVSFFGYDPLAKVLYRKLSVDFEERI